MTIIISYNNTMIKYTLTIYVDDEELYDKYSEAAKKQDENIKKEFPDSGFDMYVPETIISKPQQIVKVVSNVVCDMRKKGKPSGFYVYPRSSISKTPLRLANQVGIIDSGYRGPLIGVFDNICGNAECVPDYKNKCLIYEDNTYRIEKHTRLLQICTPDLSEFKVKVVKVDDISELAKQTDRGAGGFGSTGKN